MIRTLVAVVVGVLVGGVLVAGIEAVSMRAFPMPAGIDPGNAESLKEFMKLIPVGALVMILTAWAVGAFGGAFTGARIAPRSYLLVGLIVGLALWCAGLVTLLTIPHPLWFWFPALLLPIPFALLGARIARPRA